MGRRTLLLIAALLVAAVGTALVFVYVRGIDDRARNNQRAVQVLVAKAQIAAGTKVSAAEAAGAFDRKTVAEDSVAPGALSDVTPIQNLQALSTIYPGEQILQQKFGQPGATDLLSIPDGKMAISVQLSDPARVAGFVAPGSQVAVFTNIANAGGVAKEASRLLLPRVTVIAVGSTTTVARQTTSSNGQTQTEQIPTAILTLALDQTEVQKVGVAQKQGELFFALLNDKSKTDTALPATTTDNLFR